MPATGPGTDRVHFLDEQRRNRRRSFRFSVFAIVAVALAGIPLCVVVAPLLFGVTLVGVHLVDLVAPLSPSLWDWLRDVAFPLPDLWARLRGRPVDLSWFTLGLVYVAPGAILMLVAWPFIKLLSQSAGAGTMLTRLASRGPDPSVFAERQLVNVVEEMAIAGGVRPPAVRIIESPTVNAVAVGLTTDDAVILPTTGFLERLDRDQRQATVAHLIGSVGNGDLEIAAVILSVFQTWGLVALLLETPFSPARRALVRRFVRLSVDAVRRRVDPDEARTLLDTLLGGAAFDFDEMIESIYQIHPRSPLHGCFIMLVQLPVVAVLGLASIAAKQAIGLFTNLVLGPWLAAMWRARRRLADATAVELTRNPDALAGAVRTLEASDMEVPGGWEVNFLFPVWPPITEENAARQTEAAAFIVGMRLEPEPRLKRLAALGALLEAKEPVHLGWRARLRAALPDRGDLWNAIKYGVLAVLSVVLLIAITLAAASLLLIVFWQVLKWVNPRR